MAHRYIYIQVDKDMRAHAFPSAAGTHACIHTATYVGLLAYIRACIDMPTDMGGAYIYERVHLRTYAPVHTCVNLRAEDLQRATETGTCMSLYPDIRNLQADMERVCIRMRTKAGVKH